MAGAFTNTWEIYEYIERDIQIRPNTELVVHIRWSLARLKASGGQALKVFQIRSN